MSDIQAMKDMLTGLRQKKKNLSESEKVLLKASGINEEIEKANQEKDDHEAKLAGAKKKGDEAKKEKAGSIAKTTSLIAEKMNAVLPYGEAVFSYDEDDEGNRKMLIGWGYNGKVTPYNGLSGGEGKVFDAALANVLDADIIVVEAAELDPANLQQTLIELAKLDKQILVNTCHQLPHDIPEQFEIREV